MNIEDVYFRVTALLLRGPRDPRKDGSEVYLRCREVFRTMGQDLRESPVVGIGLRLIEKDEPAVEVMLQRDASKLLDAIAGVVDLRQFKVTSRVVGRIVSTARPTQGGDSLGEGKPLGKSGTFGALVEDPAGMRYLLTCHHSVAEINAGKRGRDEIWQPSSKDGGKSRDKIGVLHDFHDIVCDEYTPNLIDAAIVKPVDTSAAASGLRGIGPVNGTAAQSRFGMAVRKVGWRTRRTDGTFLYRTSFLQDYGAAGKALFVDQIGIVGNPNDFSADGDSGSLAVNDHNEAFGLVFAKADRVNLTLANPIRQVWYRFGVTPV